MELSASQEVPESDALEGEGGVFLPTAAVGRRRKRFTIVRKQKLKDMLKQAQKHAYLVARKPKPGEQLTGPVTEPTSPLYLADAQGQILKHSILGTVDELLETEDRLYASDEAPQLVGGDDGAMEKEGSVLSAKSHSSSKRSGVRSMRVTASLLSPIDAEEVPDPLTNRCAYFKTLEDRLHKARDIRAKEGLAEQEMLENLPLDQRLALKKEGQVIQRWQQRLQDWNDLTSKIAGRLQRKPSQLVMSFGDEHRQRNEEYDVIQMSIPLKEREGSSYWQMDLRNNAERYEVIGSVFSGLYCPIRQRKYAPAIIRKPRTQSSPTQKHAAPKWKTSVHMQLKRGKLKKLTPNVRAHELTDEHVSGLTLELPDMFEWAIQSSAAYLQEGGGEDRASMPEPHISTDAANAAGVDVPAVGSPTDVMSQAVMVSSPGGYERTGPLLQLRRKTNLVCEARLDEAGYVSVYLKNAGSSVVFYALTVEERAPPLTITYKAPDRQKTVPEIHPVFTCHDAQGLLLQGQEKEVVFSFRSDHVGMFSERWVLQTTPKAHIAVESSGDPVPSSRKPSGRVNIFFKGCCSIPDTNEHNRLGLRGRLERGAWELMVQELVTEVIRQVRTPRREDVIRRRQKEAFELTNIWLGLRFDMERYDALASLFSRVRAYLLGKKEQVDADGDDEDWMPGAWDSSLKQIFLGLTKVLAASGADPRVYNNGMTIRALPPPPVKQKKRRRSSLAVGKAKVQAAPQVSATESPRDAVVMDVVGMSTELTLLRYHSSLRSSQSAAAAARSALEGLADAVVDNVIAAREAAGLTPETIVPPPPPALTDKAAEEWQSILRAGEESERAALAPPAPAKAAKGKDAGKAQAKEVPKKEAPKKDVKGKKGPAQVGATPEQVIAYRYKLYKGLSAALGRIADAFVGTAVEQNAEFISQHRKEGRLPVAAKATLRPEDVEGRRVLLHVDLDVSEYFDVPPTGKGWVLRNGGNRVRALKTARESIQAVLQLQPASLILASYLGHPQRQMTTASSGPPAAVTSVEQQPPAQPSVSLSPLVQHLSTSIGHEVTYISPPEAWEDLQQLLLDGGIYLLERLESIKALPCIAPPAADVSDDEQERFPTFQSELEKQRRLRREQRERDAAMSVDICKALEGVVDILVVDDPKSCVKEDYPFNNLRTNDGLAVAGVNLHHELNAFSFFANRAPGPKLAIIGGSSISERINMLDVLIDTVDYLFIGGAVAINFLYASGVQVGGSERLVDKVLLPLVRELLVKARCAPVNLILPTDAVVGEAAATRAGVEPPPDEEEEEDEGDEGGEEADARDLEEEATEASTVLDASETKDDSSLATDLQPEVDESAGFDYEYESQEVGFEAGIPANSFILDIGPHTTKALQDIIGQCRAVFWDGLLGVAECSAGQGGTRAVVSSLVQRHDEAQQRVIVNGGSTGKWVRLFSELDGVTEEAPQSLEADDEDEGNMPKPIVGFSHICHESKLARRVLAEIPVPGIHAIADRELLGDELLLAEELRMNEIEQILREREEREKAELEAEDEEDNAEEEEAEDEDDEEEEAKA